MTDQEREKKYSHLKTSETVIYTDRYYSEKLGETRLISAWVKCPNCKKSMRPFQEGEFNFDKLRNELIHDLHYVKTAYPWVNCDHQDVQVTYAVNCFRCDTMFKFSIWNEC